jgi:hypothetical protein
MFEVYYCPNQECSNKDKVEKNEPCPFCKTISQPFGIKAATDLVLAKERYVKQQVDIQKIPKEKTETGTLDLSGNDNVFI